MAVFAYKVLNTGNGMVSGLLNADTPRQARDLLRERGLSIQSIRQVAKRSKQRRAWLDGFFSSRRENLVTGFARQLAALTSVGVRLTDAINTIAKQHRGRFEALLRDVWERVNGGSSLAEALAEHPTYFDPVFVSVVRVGQTAGDLDKCLAKLAEFRSRDARLRQRIANALAYPAFVACLSIAVVMFLTAFVVPKIAAVLESAGQTLPASTRVLLGAGRFLQTWWPAVLVVGLAGLFALRLLIRTNRGELLWHRLLFRLPVVGTLVRKNAVARFASLLATLLESGVMFLDSLAVVRRTVPNRLVRDAVAEAEESIAAGSDIAGPLSRRGTFDPVVVQMLAVGEESGQMESMLRQVAETYAEEVQIAAARMVSILEPLLIIAMASVVGVVLYSVLLPILRMGNIL